MSDFNYQDYLRNNPLLKEEKVSKKEWESMNDDKRMDALLSAIKNPNEAEKYVESKWDDLPSSVTQNMRVDEQLESDEDFGTGGSEVESLAADVVMGRISYKDAREKASKAAFSMKELNNAIAYVEDITGKSAPSYSLSEEKNTRGLAKEVADDIKKSLSPDELKLLINFYKEEGREEVEDVIEKSTEKLEEQDIPDGGEFGMSKKEIKVRQIIDKLIAGGNVAALTGVIGGLAGSAPVVALGSGIALLAGFLAKDAAWWSKQGHQYDAKEKYGLKEDNDYDPDAEQDDENVGMGYDDEGRPLGEAKDPRQIEAEREMKDEAMLYFLRKVRSGEIDVLPKNPLQAYMDMLTQTAMDKDDEKLRWELGENKLSEAYKIGDEVILRGNSVVDDILKVVSMRKKSGSDLMAYKVEFPNGEVAEYDETQLALNPFRYLGIFSKKEKMNERLNVARDALTKVYKELGATTFSKMILNLRDENVLDELANEMGNQYRGVMQEARDYGMTYPSYKVEEFNTIGDMAQNGILNLLAFAEQHKPELAGKLKSLVNDITEVIYDDMEEFDTQPRIAVKKTIKEQADEMVKNAVKVFQKEGGALGVKALEDDLDIDTRIAKALLRTMIKRDLVFLHRDGDYILKETNS